MEDLFISMTIGEGNTQEKVFTFLMKLMTHRNQLRMNHWQTKSYAEHKLTDDAISTLEDSIDKIAEAALGAYGRPKINTFSSNISDNAIVSTEYVLNCISKDLQEMINMFKEENQEGILALLGDLDGDIKKFIFLSTLN